MTPLIPSELMKERIIRTLRKVTKMTREDSYDELILFARDQDQ